MFPSIRSETDANEKALRQVEKITDSEPVKGENLLGSEDLKRQLREAKERLVAESGEPV
jgi:transcriptional regulator of met regulon